MSEQAVIADDHPQGRLAFVRRAPFWRGLDRMLLAWGPLILLVFAICYYSQYYRSGLNLGGEGGTVAVNAIRLNEGWLPVKDTTLNYNVMWFYPVAWLFKLVGPNYIALRIYFFGLCFVAGWLGFLIVRRITGIGWYALGVALLIVVIPGMMFRNYMGVLTLLNAWALLHAFVLERQSPRWRWFVVAGLALGITWLVRVDVGIFFTVIYLGLIALFPFGIRGEFLRRSAVAMAGGAICMVIALALQVPFFLDASARGYRAEFTESYTGKFPYIKSEALRLLHPSGAPASSPTPAPMRPASITTPGGTPVGLKKTPKNWVQLAQAGHAKDEENLKSGRPRQSLRDVFKQPSFYDAAFIIILYLPLLISGLVIASAGCLLAWAVVALNASLKEPALVCLVTLGSALTIFSQYFFFRPDTPHLSEFMIPFLVAMACASFYAFRLARSPVSWWWRAAAAAFLALCAVAEGLYFYQSFPKESAGTIAAARKRSYEMVADNGVRVFLKRREQKWVQDMHDIIVRYSVPSDWVVTFPYSPTINFMTNRPSYLKDLYNDNVTAGGHLQAKIDEIEQYRPAIIVIDERDINNTEISRFKNWAVPVYDYIRHHYVRIGKDGDFDENEIYVRPDKAPPQS